MYKFNVGDKVIANSNAWESESLASVIDRRIDKTMSGSVMWITYRLKSEKSGEEFSVEENYLELVKV